MSTATQAMTLKEQLLEKFETELPSLFGEAALRRSAAQQFEATGFPTRKWEDYKYINPDAVLKKGFGTRIAAFRDITAEDVAELSPVKDAYVFVIINGHFVPDLSFSGELPDGLTVESIADAVVSDPAAKAHYAELADSAADPFIAINTALADSGLFMHIAQDSVIERPVHFLHIATNEVSAFLQPRHLVVAETNAQAILIETFESIGPVRSFTNVLAEVVVADNAKLDHYRLQTENEAGHLLSTVQAHVSANALYNTYTFTTGGAFVRNNLNVEIAGEHAEAHLYGLYLPSGNSVVDNHTLVDHQVPNCMSNELYKGVMYDHSQAVFNGKIYVQRDAQKTNAFQNNKNILLSDDASINTKPQLEIYADDVKCSHGTSTGRMDEEALFYLRTRGIGEDNARKLLVNAFAEEVVNAVPHEELRNYIDTLIARRMGTV
ncbi:MAG: Fe-S cluster assembly protein SufD [Bacteroidia bacterium]|jgi:Fe-S cluster assembly protein SufD|nr:Fe-S cluster assembly protein SufD [Bacteroidia bacterium]